MKFGEKATCLLLMGKQALLREPGNHKALKDRQMNGLNGQTLGPTHRFGALAHLNSFRFWLNLHLHTARFNTTTPRVRQPDETPDERRRTKAPLAPHGTFLEAALDAVRDGHPPLRDELVQDAGRHGRPQRVQGALPGLRTEVSTRGG